MLKSQFSRNVEKHIVSLSILKHGSNERMSLSIAIKILPGKTDLKAACFN